MKVFDYWRLLPILALAIAVRLIGITFPFGDYDEGVYMATVRSVAHGYTLFSQTYNSQGPIFVYLAEILYKISPTIVSVRLLPIICSLVIIYLTFILVNEHIGRRAAIFAALWLSVDTAFLAISRTFQLDVPWVAFSFVSFYFLLRFHKSNAAIDIIGSAIFFGLSVFIKVNPIFAGVLFVYFLYMIYCRSWRFLQYSLYYLITLGVLLLIFIPPHILHTYYWITIHVRTLYIGLQLGEWGHGSRHLLLVHEMPLIIADLLAGLLLLRAAYRNREKLLAWTDQHLFILLILNWFLITVIAFTVYNPIFSHHFVFLIAPAVLLGSYTVEWAWGAARLHHSGRIFHPVIIALAGTSIFYVTQQARPIMDILNPKPDAYNQIETQAANYLRTITGKNDFVITDEQLILYLANRNTPPQLVDTSDVRISAGLLTASQLIAITKHYQPAAVALVSGRLARVPGYISYLEQNYSATTLNNEVRIFSKKH